MMRGIPDRVPGFGRLAALIALTLAVGCASADPSAATQSPPAPDSGAADLADSDSRDSFEPDTGIVGASRVAPRTPQPLTLWIDTVDDVPLGGFEAVLRFDARVARIERLDAVAPFDITALAEQFAHGRVKILATVAAGATVRGQRAVATLRWIAPQGAREADIVPIVLESVAAYSPAPASEPIRARVWLAPARQLPRRPIADTRSR